MCQTRSYQNWIRAFESDGTVAMSESVAKFEGSIGIRQQGV